MVEAPPERALCVDEKCGLGGLLRLEGISIERLEKTKAFNGGDYYHSPHPAPLSCARQIFVAPPSLSSATRYPRLTRNENTIMNEHDYVDLGLHRVST